MEGRRTILVVGGYGAVGGQVSRLLAADGRAHVVVAGRSEEKARALAGELGCQHRRVDVTVPESVEAGLAGVGLVVNCFVDVGGPTLQLAEAAARRGLVYLDLAAVPASHLRGVLALEPQARAGHGTLVTALGANPGIPAMLALSNRDALDQVDEVDLYFTLGSRLDGMTLLSLRGVGEMMRETPRQWRDGAWQEARQASRARVVKGPYPGKVYFGAAMTTLDLLPVPASLGAKRLCFWSGLEEALQGTVFLLGTKLGQTDGEARARRFLRLLRWSASRKAHVECVLEMVATGTRAGRPVTRTVSVQATEELLTAAAPVAVAQQWLAGEPFRAGAFVPPDVVPVASFMRLLAALPVHLVDEVVAR